MNSLIEYYNYLENDTNFSNFELNSDKIVNDLSDKIEDENTKKKCSYELYFADFYIEEGKHIPKFQNGSNIYPTLELFDDDFEYIKKRAVDTKNPKYKAKYNHLLWLSPHRDFVFAKEAIDSYFRLLEINSLSLVDQSQYHCFINYFKNLLTLCLKVGYRMNEIFDYAIALLDSEKLNYFGNYALMEFIVLNYNKIDSSITQKFFNYSKNLIAHLEGLQLERYLNLLIILSQKLNTSPYEFHERLGDFHISLLEKENIKGFISHHFYTKALEEYHKAKNIEKFEQTAVLLEQAKKTIDLKHVSVEIDDDHFNFILNQWWNKIKVSTDEIVENYESKDIYEYLILEQFLPKAEKLTEEISTPFLDLVTTMAFDINYNLIKKKTNGVNPYHLYLNNFSIQHIWLVFSKGQRNGKISAEGLVEYLKQNSWYGQDFNFLDSNNETQGFDWIELISPSIRSFFIQSEIDIKTNKNNSQGYILSIDSLVIKFEGLLREFSRMIGAPTIEVGTNRTEERISFDKLLDNEKLRAIVPEDDIAFFKFLFTPKGINLRNNIAHSFYRTNNYSSAVMLLLLVALLRLGNYRLEN